MTFPLPLRNEFLLGGQWVEAADRTLTRQAIEIVRGVPPEAYTADTTEVTYHVNNRDGDWSPDNPFGPYYGEIGENTPHRIVIDEASAPFTTTETGGWGDGWTEYGGDLADYAAGSGQATVDIDTLNSQRVTLYDTDLADCEVFTTIEIGQVVGGTGATAQFGTVLRAQDEDNYYEAIVLVSTGSNLTVALARRDAGVVTLLEIDGVGMSYTASTVLGLRFKIADRRLAAKLWDLDDGEPYPWTIRAVDISDDAIDDPGAFGTRSWLSTNVTNTLPFVITYGPVEVVSYRCADETVTLPPRWDLSGNDAWVEATGAGILRRLGSGEVLKSPLTRAMEGVGELVAREHWPMEDASGATQFANLVDGGSPMTITGTVNPATYTGPDGSDPMPTFAQTTATAVGPIRPMGATNWSILAIAGVDPDSTTITPLAGVAVDGGSGLTQVAIFLDHSANNLVISQTVNGSETSVDTESISAYTSDILGGDLYVYLYCDSADNLIGTIRFVSAGAEIELTAQGTVTSGGFGDPTHLQFGPHATDGNARAHAAVYDFDVSFFTTSIYNFQAMLGYPAETAGARMARLADDLDIPFYLEGDPDDTEPMGPQTSGDVLDLFEDCAESDGGLLYEVRDEVAIAYLTRRWRYNQTVTLALSYTTRGHVPAGLRPQPDDFDFVNDLTIHRRGGSFARYERTTGRRSVNPPPNGRGRSADERTLSLAADTQCAPIASWRVIEATEDISRFDDIPLDLRAMAAAGQSTAMYAAERLDVGRRLTISDTPIWIRPDLIDQQAFGLRETIGRGGRGGYAWDLEAAARPTGIWGQVGVYGPSSIVSRYQLTDCTLSADFDPASDTTFTVTTATGPLLAVKTYSTPLQLLVDGMPILVGEVTGASNPQTCKTLTIPAAATRTAYAGSAVTVGPDQLARYGR